MTISIAYLYYDILNLYGDSGNVKVLKHQLEEQGITVNLKFLTIDDPLHFQDYDFVYMGSGTEKNQKIVLAHIIKYQKEIKQAIENGTFFLVTGNALELFGKSILDKNKKKYKGLNIFKFTCKEEPIRLVEEAIFHTNLIKPNIIGFQNQSSTMKGIDHPLFEVIKGIGSYPMSKQEGIISNHFYGTYLIGPLLVRNPLFLKYMVQELVTSLDSSYKLKRFDLSLEQKAYEDYMKQFAKEYYIES